MERHAGVDPHPDLWRTACRKVAAVLGGDLYGCIEICAGEPTLELPAGADWRRYFPEPSRVRCKRVNHIPALRRLILVENAKTHMFNIERDAIAASDHDNQRRKSGKGDADRIAK